MSRSVRFDAFRLISSMLLILVVLMMDSCSPGEKASLSIQVGSTQQEILDLLGTPDQSQQFTIPDEPFFGPQEGLLEIVPAGTRIEEWQYTLGDQVLYVWFTGDNDQVRDQWLVISHATYPEGAIY